MDVQCNCGAITRMHVFVTDFFHLGSFKDSMVKQYINNEKHNPMCLWCGFRFTKIDEVLALAKPSTTKRGRERRIATTVNDMENATAAEKCL